MLTDLVLVRSAMGSPGPDLSRHAAVQCSYGRLRRLLTSIANRLNRKSPDADFS